mgnify:CR=1 FL=1
MKELLETKAKVDFILSSLQSKKRELVQQINKTQKLSHKIQCEIDEILNYNELSPLQICNFYKRRGISDQGRIKFLKRGLKGVRPIGVEGVHYRKTVADIRHVNDSCADFEGQIIYLFIQGKTKFLAKDVVQALGHPKFYKRHKR